MNEEPSIKRSEAIAGWLMIATRDLCPAAKERIVLEIREHFDEAVAAHVAEGLPSVEAQSKACEELGDAEVAAKRFRKRHLTIEEFEFAEGKREAWLNSKSSWQSPLLWLLVVGVCWWMDSLRDAYFLVSACVLLFQINWFSRRAARAYYTDAAIKKLGLIWVSQLLIFPFLARVLSPLSWIVLLVCLSLPNRLWFSILYKLFTSRKSVTDQNS